MDSPRAAGGPGVRLGRAAAGMAAVACLFWAAGCSHPKYPNAEAQCPPGIDPPRCASPYTFESMALNPGNSDELFVCLTFSGGGTRAAALAYGVLQELQATPIRPAADGRERSMLDEVDIISSVSGGSFTALAYKHWGKNLFTSPFAERFLYHNVTGDLIVRVIVQNLFILPIIFPDRIHIAADYVNEAIFDHAGYSGLGRQRPFVVVNATSMSGHRLEFTQDDFDLLGSDLNSVPLGHAAMASSAYPLLLSPMRLRYYANGLSSRAIRDALANPWIRSTAPRRSQWAREIVNKPDGDGIDSEQHQFVYLIDGGVLDNLGLEYVLDAYRDGPIRRRLDATDDGRRIRNLVVIAVNAVTELPRGIEGSRKAPGLLEMGSRAAAIAVDSHSRRTLELTRSLLARGDREAGPQVSVIEINMNDLPDPRRRATLLALPTRFDLQRCDVDALIAAGRELLRTHSDFIKLEYLLNK